MNKNSLKNIIKIIPFMVIEDKKISLRLWSIQCAFSLIIISVVEYNSNNLYRNIISMILDSIMIPFIFFASLYMDKKVSDDEKNNFLFSVC